MSEVSTGWERRLIIVADKFIYWLTRHWLLLFSSLISLILVLAFIAPLLQAWGYVRLGHILFRFFRIICHQKPERSFFVLGYQVAFCQRDVGIFAGLIFGGLLYSLSGRKLQLRSVRWYLLVFVLPVAVDGLTQLFGWHESTWPLRLSTGILLGIGTIFFAYPVIQASMLQTKNELDSRFGAGLAQLPKK